MKLKNTFTPMAIMPLSLLIASCVSIPMDSSIFEKISNKGSALFKSGAVKRFKEALNDAGCRDKEDNRLGGDKINSRAKYASNTFIKKNGGHNNTIFDEVERTETGKLVLTDGKLIYLIEHSIKEDGKAIPCVKPKTLEPQ